MKAGLVAILLAVPSADAPLVRSVAGAEVDWAAGTITARGGAAADLRMPNADAARPGAERRARAAALAKLKAALEELAPKRKAEAALAKARAVDVEYQSNGGVLLSLVARFGDLAPAGGEVTLAVPAMPLELAPAIAAGEKEAALGFAVYRLGDPPASARAIAVRRDREGRLQLPRSEAAAIAKLAGAAAVIYVGKVSR